MAGPVGTADLVMNQRIHRFAVGHAQQRLGQRHQPHTLFAVEAIFGEETLHQPQLAPLANRLHQLRRIMGNALALGGVEPGLRDQSFDQGRLIGMETGMKGGAIDGMAHGGGSVAVRLICQTFQRLFA